MMTYFFNTHEVLDADPYICKITKELLEDFKKNPLTTEEQIKKLQEKK